MIDGLSESNTQDSVTVSEGIITMASFQHTQEVHITNATFVLNQAGVVGGTASGIPVTETVSTASSDTRDPEVSNRQADIYVYSGNPPHQARVSAAVLGTDSPSDVHPTSRRANVESRVQFRADHDVYYSQLLVKGRGSPMWIPGPDLNLPEEYRREGVMLGDVGILYNLEGFSFLFNIFLPADHPINVGRVPDGFEPLDYSRLRHEVKKQTLFGPGDYLASSSVQKLDSFDTSNLVFEASATAGAVLTMPDGATTNDLMSRKSIRQYVAKNAESWYWFVREVREREVENGDIRLVVGCDRVSSWGIATFASSIEHQVRLEFRARDDISETYRWNCVGSGSGRVGPYEEDIKDLRTGTANPKNQCVFLRTLNFNLAGEIWDNLVVHQVRSLYAPNQSNKHVSGRQPGSSGEGSGGGESSSTHGVTFHGTQFGLSVVHPANSVNRCLLKKYPEARIAITEDEDWMSLVTHKDVVFPKPDELWSRLLAGREISEEDGIVTFKTQEDKNEQVSMEDFPKSQLIGDYESNTSPVVSLFPFTEPHEAEESVTNAQHASVLRPVSKTLGTDKGTAVDTLFNEDAPTMLPTSHTPSEMKTVANRQDRPKGITVPQEQTEAFRSTRTKVAQAVASALEIRTDILILHEALFLEVDLLQFAPVPELAKVANILLTIWGVVQQVDMYRLACLRQTARCADILLSIRHEVQEAGGRVGGELAASIAKLEEPFLSVHRLILQQSRRPWLKRYLKRSDTLNDISACDTQLRDVLGLFSISIQIRVLKLVQEDERRRQAELQALTTSVLHGHFPLNDPDTKLILGHGVNVTTGEPSPGVFSTDYALESSEEYGTTRNALGLLSDADVIHSISPMKTIPASSVVPAIHSIYEAQNSLDTALDITDLRQLMHATLQTGSDAEILDEPIAQIKNERRYRLLLTHDYHPSLSLPLWSPTPVPLGAVGYLSKPKGEFITLFSAYSPDKASHPLIAKLPSIDDYGHAGRSEHRQDRRTVAQKALDLIYGGSLTFGNFSKQVSRRYSFPLKAAHKIAYLYAEITQYEYMESLDAPRKWFQIHVDAVMEAYGREHRIQREDLVLVIGALRVPNYGLFVSHSHPEGHVHFSVYASQKVGQPWGTFTDVPPGSGPSYENISASKVSRHGDPWSAVLLARLRFKPDALDPTSK